MREKALRSLEYSKILSQIAAFSSSSSAREKIMSILPMQKIEDIEFELDKVDEADKMLFQYSVSPNFNFDDIVFALERAKVMSVLTMGELLRVSHVLKVARNLQSQILKVPDESIKILKGLGKTIYVNKSLEDDIDKAILSDTEMNDNASPELAVIRTKIKRAGENIKIKLNSYVRSADYSQYIQDNIITVRNDRYVVPVKSAFRGAIPGLIHDESASGATVYIEPMVIVEMNNQLKTLVIEEKNEIERILRAFTSRISGEVGFIKYTFDVITDLDVIFAKAYYAERIKAIRPLFNARGEVNIQKGRHPLIDKEKVISNTVYIGKDFDLLFITGPNTGGKTVCLKLLGIIELMGMSGIFVPAQYAMLSNFDNVFCDIGDEQSIEQNLSTFSSHMTNVVNIIKELTTNTLVLFDELGAGTDPTEGASLALSICDYIKEIGAKAVITTHYNELKEYAVVTERAMNASMDFNPDTYSPTYHLIIGTPGASNALYIAERLGLKKEIIDKAREGISSQKFEFENIVLALEKSRKTADDNLAETEEIKARCKAELADIEKEKEKLYLQREKLNVSVKKETKKLVENAMDEANEIITEMRELLDEPTEGAIFKAQKLRKSLKKYIINEDNEFQEIGEELEGDIVVGDSVLIKSLNSEGEVINVNPIKGEAKIKLGNISTNIKFNDLQRLRKKNNEQAKKYVTETKQTLYNEQVSPEINLIGLASDEAVYAVEEYLDKALRAGLNEVRIIHGYGEGILRKAVRDYLAKNKCVVSYRDGKFDEGSKGVTIVTLK